MASPPLQTMTAPFRSDVNDFGSEAVAARPVAPRQVATEAA